VRGLFLILPLLALFSCHRNLKRQPSVLESYKQFQVISEVKRGLKRSQLNPELRDELIAFGEELAPKDAEMKLLKAANLKIKGRTAEAKYALEGAIALSPDYGPALSAYGELLIANGSTEEGRSYCIYAAKLNPIDLAARRCAKK
jgi:hypothetical protein